MTNRQNFESPIYRSYKPKKVNLLCGYSLIPLGVLGLLEPIPTAVGEGGVHPEEVTNPSQLNTNPFQECNRDHFSFIFVDDKIKFLFALSWKSVTFYFFIFYCNVYILFILFILETNIYSSSAGPSETCFISVFRLGCNLKLGGISPQTSRCLKNTCVDIVSFICDPISSSCFPSAPSWERTLPTFQTLLCNDTITE